MYIYIHIFVLKLRLNSYWSCVWSYIPGIDSVATQLVFSSFGNKIHVHPLLEPVTLWWMESTDGTPFIAAACHFKLLEECWSCDSCKSLSDMPLLPTLLKQEHSREYRYEFERRGKQSGPVDRIHFLPLSVVRCTSSCIVRHLQMVLSSQNNWSPS